MKTITLWRCVGVSELHDLIENGKVLGKIYEENVDSDYKQDLGPCVMMFDVPAICPESLGYQFMLEIEVPESRIIGKGMMRWFQDNLDDDFEYSDTDYYETTEVYVSEYSISDVKKIVEYDSKWADQLFKCYQPLIENEDWEDVDDKEDIVKYYAHNLKDEHVETMSKWIENFYYGDPEDQEDLDHYRYELEGFKMGKIIKRLDDLRQTIPFEYRDSLSSEDLKWRLEHKLTNVRFRVRNSKNPT